MAETEKLEAEMSSEETSPELSEEYEAIVSRWAGEVTALGIEVKGLWLIDFDSGSGYYCWHYPEPSLQFFHDYDTGFGGRVRLT